MRDQYQWDACRYDAEFISHVLRIAAEAAPGATRKQFVAAATEAGFHPKTAGIQFTISQQLSAEMATYDAENN